ncbi:MAG: alginate lyase family protein [Armatimonadetes bacterium]|nr:alginate lyase family protein [Armatimonadota bacterium]
MNLALCLLLAVAAGTPHLVCLDPARVADGKARLTPADPALGRLRREADKALALTPPSVMNKTRMPPSGDKHDYLSLGTYAWPDPAKPDGLPWINRDGEVNPESRIGADHDPLVQMAGAVTSLALAWYYTGHEPYADKAVAFLRVWFLDEATRMNPHLNFAQGVPGKWTGSGTGIIDTTALVPMVDALGLIEGAPAYTPTVHDALATWFGDYYRWMRTSHNGRNEERAANNHGTWYRVQAAAFALFAGQRDEARALVEGAKPLLASHIEPDGRQPLELRRTKSYTYSVYNLNAWFSLAQIGRNLDVDLYNYRTDDGRCLRVALDYLAPYLADPTSWKDKQIETVRVPDQTLASLLRQAALVYGEPRYEAMLAPLAKELAPARLQLLWPAANEAHQP